MQKELYQIERSEVSLNISEGAVDGGAPQAHRPQRLPRV